MTAPGTLWRVRRAPRGALWQASVAFGRQLRQWTHHDVEHGVQSVIQAETAGVEVASQIDSLTRASP
jgi:hypothetical protein